jgi:hypothetical protein
MVAGTFVAFTFMGEGRSFQAAFMSALLDSAMQIPVVNAGDIFLVVVVGAVVVLLVALVRELKTMFTDL